MIDHLRGLVFLHVPKCAGMAVEEALGGLPDDQQIEQHWGWEELSRYHPGPWSDYQKFAIVRHPLDRMRAFVRFYRRFDPIWRRHLAHVDERRLLLDLLFTDNLLSRRTAHRMIPDGVEVLPFEQLDTAWPRFAARHQLPAQLPRKNIAPATPREPLPPVMAHVVAAWFPEGHTRFGYPLPEGELQGDDRGTVAWARLHAWAGRLPTRLRRAVMPGVRLGLDAFRASLPEPAWQATWDRIVDARPPRFRGNVEARLWVSLLHDDVNRALGKPLWEPWAP